MRVEEIADLADPPPGWARLRVEACGLCGTDVEEFEAGPNMIPTTSHPLSGRQAPLTLGHEAVGVIEAVGAGVALDLGASVAVESNMYCGTCWWCTRREYQLCSSQASLGLMADGGLSEAMLAPAYMCVPFDHGTPPTSVALAEPLSVAVRAVRRGGVGVGSHVAVIGAGTIGLLLVQMARIAGAATVTVGERLPARRALAMELGADIAVDPDELTDAAAERSKGVGPDVVFEAAGNRVAGTAAVRLARRGGCAVLLGVFDADVPLPMMNFLLGEKTVIASLSHVCDGDFTTAVSLIERQAVEVAPLITDVIPLTDVVVRGLEVLVSEPEAHLKVLVSPHAVGLA